MQSVKVFGLAILGVVIVIMMGVQQLPFNQNLGLFFVFIGGCTSIGVLLDLITHIKVRIRKNNIRKLQP
ncbi:hypothetical protein [Pseudochryseolinea flava]|uniref:Uncharacterized protein n=1 Tax=Pseudochryseolinea flava TaxID=2059302 RepID=A0A364Y0E5_9BACT|nr:hypothetical protein [Pseudochryseolinea flava]RAW00125.1 hypothetical protein DQQ10_16385 [Pseudochryseolinea flava]